MLEPTVSTGRERSRLVMRLTPTKIGPTSTTRKDTRLRRASTSELRITQVLDVLDDALADLTGADTVIAVSASGSTPYTVAAVEIARTQGATVVAIANNAGAPLLELADHAILLETPPEPISGSTRMGAGTAQKIALNMLSTLMAIRLGHVHDGMMVNLRVDNIKLRQRAERMVSQIACVDEARAKSAMNASDDQVKPAILIAAGNVTAEQAQKTLIETQGQLRPALTKLT